MAMLKPLTSSSLYVYVTFGTMCLIWLSVCNAQPGRLEAIGLFSRPLTGSPYTIGSGVYFNFHIMDSITNTEYFEKVISPPGVRIKKPGIYLVIAEAPFEGPAQMRFRLNQDILHTTVGQEPSGILSGTAILNVTTAPQTLRWRNPSNHVNVVPSSISETDTHAEARLIILGLEVQDQAFNVSSYLYAVSAAGTNRGYPCYGAPCTQVIGKGIYLLDPNGYGFESTGTYLAIAQASPRDQGFGMRFTQGMSHISDCRWPENGQYVVSGLGFVNFPVHWDNSYIDYTAMHPDYKADAGGNVQVYQSVIFVGLHGMQGIHLTHHIPYNDVLLPAFSRLPLDTRSIGNDIHFDFNETTYSWKYKTGGIYLTGTRFNSRWPITQTLYPSATKVQGNTYHSQLGGFHLTSEYNATAENYIEVDMETLLTKRFEGQQTDMKVSTFAILVG